MFGSRHFHSVGQCLFQTVHLLFVCFFYQKTNWWALWFLVSPKNWNTIFLGGEAHSQISYLSQSCSNTGKRTDHIFLNTKGCTVYLKRIQSCTYTSGSSARSVCSTGAYRVPYFLHFFFFFFFRDIFTLQVHETTHQHCLTMNFSVYIYYSYIY